MSTQAKRCEQHSQAESLLEHSRQRMRLHVEQSPLAAIEFDLEGRVSEWNPAAQTVFGYSREEALGQHWTFIVPDAVWPSIDGVWGSLVSQTGGSRSTNENITKDGRTIQCEWYSASLVGPDGSSVGVASLVMDVTERRQVESALQASQDRLENAMDLAGLVDWELDARTGVFTFNDRFFALYGTTAEREGGYQMPAAVYAERFVHPEERDLVAEEIGRALESDDPDFRAYVEHRIVRPDGEIRHVAVRYLIVRDEHGTTVRTHGANQDITERKRGEEALAQAEAQLRQSQKMEAMGQLAGGIAHDFNNLLTTIMGNSELALLTMAPEDPNREMVVDIKQAGERAAGLTRQILAFSRRQTLRTQTVSLNDIVERIRPLLDRTLGEHIDLQVLPAGDLRPIDADPNQLEQVIMNLCVNARDAMPEGGRLTVETANAVLKRADCAGQPELRPGAYALLMVSDNGSGMDEQTRSRIFEPFFTTKDVGKGTGLGLSTVFGIVKQSAGCIRVETQPGKGTAFKVYLPVRKRSVAKEKHPQADAAPKAGTETILVVEDEATVRGLIVRVLSRSGYKLVEAGSAIEADALLAGKGPIPDLLLTDVVLPGGKSGRVLAQSVRAARPSLPVILMSGHTQDSAVLDGDLGEGVDFLRKPFTPSDLLHRVRAALDL